MPFRARMKRAFGTNNSNQDYDPSNPLTHGISKKSKREYPDNVYKPGEPMPRPKYRGPWNQAHQDKLSAFSFGNAWKRSRTNSATTDRSERRGSLYSPMGSRLPSRGPSRRGSAWSAFSDKVTGKRARASRHSVDDWHSHSEGHTAYGATGSAVDDNLVRETSQRDDDVSNVGLSRQHTNDRPPSKASQPPVKDRFTSHQMHEPLSREKTVTLNGNMASGGFHHMERLDPQRTVTDGQMFTADELAVALSQSSLKPGRREEVY